VPAVLVHGVPDTWRLWDAVRARLARRDVVAPALPGFGTPLPARFDASKEAYVGWLVETIAALGEPVDLVGHDWGGTLVQRVVSVRPDLVRTWACGSSVVDAEYVWHDVARQWQTPELGEQMMEMTTPDLLAETLAASGVPRDAAADTAARVDATMKRAILALYRSAVEVGAEWQPDVERITRPGLVFWGADDPFADVRFAERLAARVHGELVLLAGCGHWWPLERPDEVATALERFWSAKG
jgi:pimeloyl-ACP methyl ester carboxylesterase